MTRQNEARRNIRRFLKEKSCRRSSPDGGVAFVAARQECAAPHGRRQISNMTKSATALA
jgi:hypothetical protein